MGGGEVPKKAWYRRLCPPFYITQLVRSQPFYIPEAWKKYSFRAEPPRIGHYKEYPPGFQIKLTTSEDLNSVSCIWEDVKQAHFDLWSCQQLHRKLSLSFSKPGNLNQYMCFWPRKYLKRFFCFHKLTSVLRDFNKHTCSMHFTFREPWFHGSQMLV